MDFWKAPGRLAFLALGLLAAVAFATILMNDEASDRRQADAIIMLGIPFGIIAFIGLAVPGEPYGLNFVRGVFVLAAIALPAALYALFLASCRESLLQSYLNNLTRLGMFARRKIDANGVVALYVPPEHEAEFEPESERQTRVRRYLDRFASLYGPLPESYINHVISATDSTKPFSKRVSLNIIPADAGTFGLRAILPVIIATILFAIGWCAVLPVLQMIPAASPHVGLHLLWFAPEKISPSGYAFLGAYFFSLQMIVRRFIRRDLGPNAYVNASMRTILAVIAAWILIAVYPWQNVSKLSSAISTSQSTALDRPNTSGLDGPMGEIETPLKQDPAMPDTQNESIREADRPASPDDISRTLIAMAFVVGVFPYVIWQVIGKAIAWGSTRITFIPDFNRGQSLSQLEGLTIWHESRLEEEDIENVENMVNADIPDLMLQTKLPSDRLIDWVDEAIFLKYVRAHTNGQYTSSDADLRTELANYGITTATNLISLCKNGIESTNEKKSIGDIFSADSKVVNRILSIAEAMNNELNLAKVQRWKGVGGKLVIDAGRTFPRASGD
jgi:hypothetical protein